MWCGSRDREYTCFTRQADCVTDRSDCKEIPSPHWSCSRVFRKLDHSLHFALCYPTAELCANDEVYATDERESCTPSSSVYCRDFEGSLACHPTRAICEREAIGFAGDIRPVSACIAR